MAMISEILDDWFLNPDEVTLIKRHKKTLITLPKGYNLNTSSYIFCNGLTLKVDDLIIMTIEDIRKITSYDLFEKYGIKTYIVEATGDHPKFLLYAYIKYDKQLSISYESSKEALIRHLYEYENFDEDEPIIFYKIRYINS